MSGREEIPHKCAGTKTATSAIMTFTNKEEGNLHPCQNGKHCSPVLPNENFAQNTRN